MKTMKTEIKGTLITSAGILRDREKPRTGILHDNECDSSLFDLFYSKGVDIAWLDAIDDLENEIKHRLVDEGLTGDALGDALERALDEERDHLEVNGYYLIGFRVTVSGRHGEKACYEIDPNADFSATWDTESGYVCIEHSKTTKVCGHTSPCFVMSDGRGPCADLTSKGETCIGYSLPTKYIRREQK